jgi:hypothetical protein
LEQFRIAPEPTPTGQVSQAAMTGIHQGAHNSTLTGGLSSLYRFFGRIRGASLEDIPLFLAGKLKFKSFGEKEFCRNHSQ